MASSYMYRTPASSGSGITFTISFWCKRGKLAFGNQTPFISHKDGSNYVWLRFNNSDQLQFTGYKAGPETFSLKTNAKFRDVASWMHICTTFDSTESVAADRIKIYVNGVKETAFADETYPTEDNTMIINDTTAANVVGVGYSGATYVTADNHWNGSLSHIHFVDGTAYQASTFGETDSTSGIWKIKTSPTVTYGTNGFFLKGEDRSNLDLDSGTNAFTFTTSGTPTATYDNPSNNFCTMNPLDNYYCGATLSNGNDSLVTGSSPYAQISSTLAASAGKWYWEVKPTAGNYWLIGAASSPAISTADHAGYSAYSNAVYYSNGNNYVNNASSAYASSYTANDIISVALDLDNNKLYYAKNGAWGTGSGAWDSTTFDAAVGAITITAPASTTTGIYFPVVSDYDGSGTATFQCNFGNGYFGTTAVASTNADDAGIGSFEYDVPTGFYALCTKNIKAYGG